MHLLDEVAEHAFGRVEVGDDAVLQRTDRNDVARRTADHGLSVGTDGNDAALGLVDRNNGRLVQDDAATAYVDEGVGSAQVDGHVTVESGVGH